MRWTEAPWLLGCVDNRCYVNLSSYCHMHCDPLATTRRHKRTALFCVISQRVVVIPYRRFGTTYRSQLILDSWPLKTEPNRVSVVIRRLTFAFGFTKCGIWFFVSALWKFCTSKQIGTFSNIRWRRGCTGFCIGCTGCTGFLSAVLAFATGFITSG